MKLVKDAVSGTFGFIGATWDFMTGVVDDAWSTAETFPLVGDGVKYIATGYIVYSLVHDYLGWW